MTVLQTRWLGYTGGVFINCLFLLVKFFMQLALFVRNTHARLCSGNGNTVPSGIKKLFADNGASNLGIPTHWNVLPFRFRKFYLLNNIYLLVIILLYYILTPYLCVFFSCCHIWKSEACCKEQVSTM